MDGIITTPFRERQIYPDAYLKTVKASTKYAFIEDAGKLNFEHTDAFTIHVAYMPTVQPLGSNPDAYVIVSKAIHKADGTSIGWRLIVDGNNKLMFSMYVNTADVITPAITAGTSTDIERPIAHRINWVTLTWSGSASKVARIYKNGRLTNTGTANLNLLSTTSHSIKNGEQAGLGCLHRTHIDQSAKTPALLLNGGFQTLAAFNKELTEAEVKALYSSYSGLPEALKASCVGHYIYPHDGGDKMLDLSPHYDYAKTYSDPGIRNQTLNDGTSWTGNGAAGYKLVTFGTGNMGANPANAGTGTLEYYAFTDLLPANSSVHQTELTITFDVVEAFDATGMYWSTHYLNNGTPIKDINGLDRFTALGSYTIKYRLPASTAPKELLKFWADRACTLGKIGNLKVVVSGRIVTPSHALLKNHTNTEMGIDHPHNTTAIESVYTKKTVAEPLRAWCTNALDNTLPYNSFSLATHTDFNFTISDEIEIETDYRLIAWKSDQGGQGLISWMNNVPWSTWSGFFLFLGRPNIGNVGYCTTVRLVFRLEGVGAIEVSFTSTASNYVLFHDLRKIRIHKAAGSLLSETRLFLNDKEYPMTVASGADFALTQTFTTTSEIRLGAIYSGEPAQNNNWKMQDGIFQNFTYKLRGNTIFQQQGLKDIGPANRAIAVKGAALSNSNPTFGHLLNDQSGVVRKALYLDTKTVYADCSGLANQNPDVFTMVLGFTLDAFTTTGNHYFYSHAGTTTSDYCRMYFGGTTLYIDYRNNGDASLQVLRPPIVKNLVNGLNFIVLEFDHTSKFFNMWVNGRLHDKGRNIASRLRLSPDNGAAPRLFNYGATQGVVGHHYLFGVWNRKLTGKERNHIGSFSQLRLPGNFMRQGCELLLLPGYAEWDAGVSKHKLLDYSGKRRHVHMENYPQTSYLTESIQNLRLRY